MSESDSDLLTETLLVRRWTQSHTTSSYGLETSKLVTTASVGGAPLKKEAQIEENRMVLERNTGYVDLN